MKVYVIGCGMGNPDTLTVEAARATNAADVIIGAARLIAPYQDGAREVLALTRSADIEQALRAQAALPGGSARTAAVLMSGDVGFYSGAVALHDRLKGFEVEVIAGVSSVSYFCAKLRTSWHDAFLVSAHGRSHNAGGEIQCHEKTFVITGGATKAHDICRDLVRRGFGDVRVAVGERLSYEDERIVRGSASELAGDQFTDLAVMLVENDRPVRQAAAPALADGDFERTDVPMTKEEVRHLAVCKLKLTRDAVVWDIGAGTGSVSCEVALAACAGEVFAVERNEEAACLVERNAARLGARNVHVVRGVAPEACADLPAPTHLFVGGSAGCLRDALACALERNPSVRVVASAVTLETLAAALDCVRNLPLEEVDIAQVQVSRAREMGSYHLMSAHNPVYLVSAQGRAAYEGGAR